MLSRGSGRRGNTSPMRREDERSDTRVRSRHAREVARALPRGTSYLTDEGEMLARELPRQNLLARMTSSRGSDEFVGDDGEIDKMFIAEIVGGVYRRLPDKALFVLRERRAGTMTEMGEGRVLPTRWEDVRRRQEHLNCGVVEMNGVRSGGRGGLGMVREAFIQEFRDLYEIVGSMEARKWDLCKGDVCGMFEWFKMIENFLRAYVVVTQKGYVKGGVGDWGICEKRKIIEAGERVEEMKRVMIALDGRCGDMVGRLRRRVEELVERVLGFLEEERRRVGHVLDGGFDNMVTRMSEEDCGREMVVLLGRGCRDVEWGKKLGGWRAVRRVKERHWDYVSMFVAAEREYRTMYGQLGDEMDRGIVEVDTNRE